MHKFNKKNSLKEVTKLYKRLNSSEKVAEKISIKYGIPKTESLSRKIRKWVSSQKKETSQEEAEIFKVATLRKFDTDHKYFFITAAQNATSVNTNLLENMKAYADYLKDTRIEVIPYRYRNPTGPNEKTDDEWWDSSIHNYLIANRHNIHRKLQVLGDVKMQPTASMPLSGMEGMSGSESCIVGHPRQHLKIIPGLKKNKKILLSTGVITDKNYSVSKAGSKAKFHHTFGFVIVEKRDKNTFHLRQISANKDGSFYDLDNHVINGEVLKTKSKPAIVFGDLHLGDHCEKALKTSYKMLERFNPKHVILHDIMNGHSISHHEKNDPFIQLQREEDGSWNLENELNLSIEFLETVLDYSPVVVKSNHDIFVDRFLVSADWRKEKNKYSYLKYAKLKADGKLPNGILPYEIEQSFGNKVTCLTENDSFKLAGVELGIHGHSGTNGSRGTPTQFKRLNSKMISAHSHTPHKEDGVSVAGTLTKLRVGYNNGLSSWMNCNVLLHENGKTQHLIIIDGEYTTIE